MLKTLLPVCLLLLSSGSISYAQSSDNARSPIPNLSPAELDNGRSLFRVHCARCHGMLGEGGEGPNLKRRLLRHAKDDQTLLAVIVDGIQGTGMPGTFGPNETEMWQLAGYVRSLGKLPAEAMPGDPKAGAMLYADKGNCATCHILAGQGRGVGPELSAVGLRRNATYLRRSLTNPDADYPMKTSVLNGRVNAFLTVRVVAPEGEFEGMRVNEDEFSVQVRDLTGNIRSFDKRNLLKFEKALGHSLMPGYDRIFNATQVNDLVSYLMSLKGGF